MAGKIIMGLIAMAIAIGFLAVPVIKLQSIPLIVIILIGVGMMVYEFIERVRNKDE